MPQETPQITMGLPQLLQHTPKWASAALAILGFVYGIYMMSFSYGLFILEPNVEHKINGVYAILNMILLSFGPKKKEETTQ